jgi:hypothetical protein
MSTDYERHRRELDEILQGLMTDKRMSQSDKKIIAMAYASYKSLHDPIALKNRADGIVKRSLNSNWHKNRNESLEGIYETEEWQEAFNDGLQKREKNGWHEKNKKASNNQLTPCITPLGIFMGVQEAGRFYDETKNRKCGSTVVCRNLKKGTLGYRYITREEYIKLTGDNPWQ